MNKKIRDSILRRVVNAKDSNM